MSLKLSTAAKNVAANAVAGHANGAGRAYIQIRSGSRPTSPDSTATGTLLATIQMQTTAFGSAVTGIASANGTPLTGTIVASGTAGWFRLCRGNGAAVADGTITGTGDGGDIEMDVPTLVSGGTVSIQAFSLSQL